MVIYFFVWSILNGKFKEKFISKYLTDRKIKKYTAEIVSKNWKIKFKFCIFQITETTEYFRIPKVYQINKIIYWNQFISKRQQPKNISKIHPYNRLLKTQV